MNPNATPYHPAPRFHPQPQPQSQINSRLRPYPQPTVVDTNPAANAHFAIYANAPLHLKERQMQPANQPVVLPSNGVPRPVMGTQPGIMFGSVPAPPQAANGPPANATVVHPPYPNQYPQPHPIGMGVISGGTGLGQQRGAGNASTHGQGYNHQYRQAMDNVGAASGSGPSQDSSKSESASSSSKPPSNPTGTSIGGSALTYVSYQGLPVPACRNPLSPCPFPLPSTQEYNERKDVVKLHRLLSASSRNTLFWDIRKDPYYAQCAGRRITYDEQMEQAFLEPGCKDIIVFVSLDCSDARGFPSLAPEKGQRIYCFPVSAYPGSVCLHKLYAEEVLLGSSWQEEEETLYATPDSQTESLPPPQSNTSETDQMAPSSPESKSSEEEQEVQKSIEYKLDIRGVLDGIRDGLRTPITQSEWTTLTLHEKITLAWRVSIRRAEWDRLSSACNIDFLKRTLDLESSLPKIQKRGDVIQYNKACDVIREAHKRLDLYAFESGYYYPDHNTQGAGAFRKTRRSKEGVDERGREPVRVIDFFPPGKTAFKGLRWMGWKPVGGIEAFFLCIA